jgi:tetratricopeptide (TPR) repeat protein
MRWAAIFSGALAVVAVIVALWGWYQKTVAESQKREADLQRDLAVFSVGAAKNIAGPVSGQLLRLGDAAQIAIRSKSTTDRVATYLDFADYYLRAWKVDEAKDTLGSVWKFIEQAQSSGEVGDRLRLRYHEISGDINRLDERNFDEADRNYKAAFEIVKGFDDADPDRAPEHARLFRKMAEFYLRKNNFKAAGQQLDAALDILGRRSDPAALRESALLAVTRAEFSLRQGPETERNVNWARAIDLLRKAQDAESPEKRMSISLELATALQKQGDLQRRNLDPQALTSYTAASELLDKVLTDDPTSSIARKAIALARHGIRLLGAATQADADTTKRRDQARALIDQDFGRGIGKFQFGMSVSEVNQLLHSPFAKIVFGDLPRADEWETGEVRYLVTKVQEEPDFYPFPLSTCLQMGENEIILFFHEDTLFRFSFRFFKSPLENCDEHYDAFVKFAEQYGLTIIGSEIEPRFRYDTERVGVDGIGYFPRVDDGSSRPPVAMFDFTQR